jgi:hypothetical protein
VDADTLRSLVIIYIDALLRGTPTRGVLDGKMNEIAASLAAKLSA